MTQKEIAIEFLQLAGMGQVNKAFQQFTSSNFFHHNQYFNGSREALQQAMQEDHLNNPNRSIETKFCYQEENTVITHSLVVKEEMNIAVVHIFRFENDQIVELWDLGQVIEPNSPNEFGLF